LISQTTTDQQGIKGEMFVVGSQQDLGLFCTFIATTTY
jgi:hypothetical protein